MATANKEVMDCTTFEERLSDYLEYAVEKDTRKAMSAHALSCPLCHSLMNEVKHAIAACHQLGEPKAALSRLDAQILARTAPETAIDCEEFEAFLTDYLDGFIAANVFHRWERHAAVCDDCTDLPGAVVRSLAALVNYKLEELPVPFGLHERIMQATLGGERVRAAKPSWSSRVQDWLSGLRWPVSVPQLAPVAMMGLFAFLFVSQTVSADGSLTDIYSKSYQLAEKTYEQGANVWNGKPVSFEESGKTDGTAGDNTNNGG